MKQIIRYLFWTVLALPKLVYADGVDGGGSGFVCVDPEAKNEKFTKISYSQQMQELKRSFPTVELKECPAGSGATGVYPLVTPEYRKYFRFEILDNRHAFTKLFLSEKKPERFTEKAVCRNQNILEAYGQLVANIYGNIKGLFKYDSVGRHLIEKTYEVNGPIQFVITRKPMEVKISKTMAIRRSGQDVLAEGKISGVYQQFAWHQKMGDKIFWSRPFKCAPFGGRLDVGVLRHEIAHSLYHRALMKHYPAEYSASSGYTLNSENKMHPFETSVVFNNRVDFWGAVADSEFDVFMEAMATNIEVISANDHPFLNDQAEPGLPSFRSSAKTESKFYDTRAWKAELRNPGTLNRNIGYMAGALDKLNNTYEANSEYHIKNGDYVVGVKSSSVINKTIDLIAEKAPRNTLELAKGIDEKIKADLGYRWYLQYFFYDYKKGRSTLQDFIEVENDGGHGDGFAVSVNPWFRNVSIDQYQEDLRSTIKEQVRQRFLSQEPIEKVKSEIATTLDEVANSLALSEKHILSVEEAYVFRRSHSRNGARRDDVDNIYRRYEKGYGRTYGLNQNQAALNMIWSATVGNDPQVTAEMKKRVEMGDQIPTIAFMPEVVPLDQIYAYLADDGFNNFDADLKSYIGLRDRLSTQLKKMNYERAQTNVQMEQIENSYKDQKELKDLAKKLIVALSLTKIVRDIEAEQGRD